MRIVRRWNFAAIREYVPSPWKSLRAWFYWAVPFCVRGRVEMHGNPADPAPLSPQAHESDKRLRSYIRIGFCPTTVGFFSGRTLPYILILVFLELFALIVRLILRGFSLITGEGCFGLPHRSPMPKVSRQAPESGMPSGPAGGVCGFSKRRSSPQRAQFRLGYRPGYRRPRD